MPMQPRPISETSSRALPRFRDLMVPPISRWPASGGRRVRVGHRDQVAHGTQPDFPPGAGGRVRGRSSPWAVKTHVGRILSKLNLRDRAQVVVTAYESGLITPGDGP